MLKQKFKAQIFLYSINWKRQKRKKNFFQNFLDSFVIVQYCKTVFKLCSKNGCNHVYWLLFRSKLLKMERFTSKLDFSKFHLNFMLFKINAVNLITCYKNKPGVVKIIFLIRIFNQIQHFCDKDTTI